MDDDGFNPQSDTEGSDDDGFYPLRHPLQGNDRNYRTGPNNRITLFDMRFEVGLNYLNLFLLAQGDMDSQN